MLNNNNNNNNQSMVDINLKRNREILFFFPSFHLPISPFNIILNSMCAFKLPSAHSMKFKPAVSNFIHPVLIFHVFVCVIYHIQLVKCMKMLMLHLRTKHHYRTTYDTRVYCLLFCIPFNVKLVK